MLRRIKDHIVCLLIMLSSFLLRAYYVSYISVIQNQHDSGYPYSNGGHLGYISWFIRNSRLPDFDVRQADQFWHPPLHYILSAGFLKAAWRLFPSQADNFEIVQLLPLLYVTAAILVIADILRLFGFHDRKAWYLTLLFVAFQPAFVIASAFVNSDALFLLLSAAVLDLAIRWYRTPGTGLILSVAVAFGLNMSTRKSAALLAIPVGYLFAARFLGSPTSRPDKSTRVKLLKQFCLFLAVGLPLSLWWYIRNLLCYGVPFSFIWIINDAENYDAYLGNIPLWKRFLDFRPVHFTYRNTYMQHRGEGIQDINPMVALWKSAASDVWSWTFIDGKIKKLSYIMFLLRTGIVILATAVGLPCTALTAFKKAKKEEPLRRAVSVSILLLLISQLISFYVFCVEYPFVWTMNYRYVNIIIVAESLFVLTALQHNRFSRLALTFLIPLFSASVVFFFYFAGTLF